MIQDPESSTSDNIQPRIRRSQLHVQRVLTQILSKAHQPKGPHRAEEDENKDCYGIVRYGTDE